MFSRTPDPTDEPLEKEIEHVLASLADLEPESKEYAKAMAQLVKLYDLKPQPLDRVKKDTWVLAGANVLGIILIVSHERAHVVTSRAVSLIGKALR